MRISDWSSDVCSSDLHRLAFRLPLLLRDIAFADRHILIIGARRGLDRLGHDGRAVDDRRDDDARRVIAVAITIAALPLGRRITVGIPTLIISAMLSGDAARPPLHRQGPRLSSTPY